VPSLSQQAQEVFWVAAENKKNTIKQACRVHHRVGSVGTFVQSVMDPLIIVFSLFAITLIFQVPLSDKYEILFFIVFLVSLIVFKEADLCQAWKSGGLRAQSGRLFVCWSLLTGILLFFGYATKTSHEFSRSVLLTWFMVAPLLILVGHLIARFLLRRFYASAENSHTAVIVGASGIGRQLAHRMAKDKHLGLGVSFVGFFDDRSGQRLGGEIPQDLLLGGLEDLPAYVQTHKIDQIYIALPMMMEKRILKLLDDLKDTTTSIYFVPDIFVFDLIQAGLGEVNGIPVVAICETPFCGVNRLVKRLSDVVLSSLILTILAPLLLLIALGVKLTSPGPVLFKQRRYGLDGKEIVVYKFRSMTVCEDGNDVSQAKRCDSRVTPFGAFLRRTSLDELPQFINVLQGRMSVVGPRPHAVIHNEIYRKQIKGYMMRHKVRPGITGLAQVSGLRGETQTLDKMQARIDCDLDYLRDWSMALDLKIIFKTIFLVFLDRRAY
jgi:putative colanic acid biosynthesis UDP-glucose lipid carrier transferase